MALAVKTTTTNTPSVLPQAQAAALFEHETQALAGISAREFLAKWDAGEYRDLDDTPEGRKIAYLVLLIPFGRQHS